jgi:hypothetical protein
VKQYIHLIEVGVLLVAVAIAINAWTQARSDATKLKATLTAEKAVIEQAATQEHDQQKILASAVAAIEAQKRQVRTSQQAASALPGLLPDLPEPLTVPKATESPDTPIAAPQPGSMNIPPQDLKPLYDHLQDCRICEVERDTAKQNLAEEQIRSAALMKERDAAIAESKGGSLWTRVRRAAKWLTIGVLAGASAATASRWKK